VGTYAAAYPQRSRWGPTPANHGPGRPPPAHAGRRPLPLTPQESDASAASKWRTLCSSPFDAVIFVYFVLHVPITVLMDAQAVFPASFYPGFLRGVLAWYLETTCDPIMGGATGRVPRWAFGIMCIEVTGQFACFFLGAHALWHRKPWFRTLGLAYGTHVATTLVPILAHLLLEPLDPSCRDNVATPAQRLQLTALYLPWLVLPSLLALKCAVKPRYFDGVPFLKALRGALKQKYL